MKIIFSSIIIFTLLFSFRVSGSESGAPFPEGKQCAVTFSIDDGFWGSSEQMADILDRYQLKASFYLVTHWVAPMKTDEIGDGYNEGASHGTWQQWKSILERGHEIGSHSCTHPALPTIDAKDALMEITESKQQLIDELGLQEPITFAYPYNQSSPEVKQMISGHYLSARIGGKPFNKIGPIDLQAVNSWWPLSNMPLEEIIAKIDEAKANGHWLVIGLHGMNDEGWNPITPQKFEGVCKYLASDSAIWVPTFREMTLRLKERQQ
ncbi:MAG: polysaccharide deacetylase family protein [Candidatus Hinthialibacter antarcticus]|nr:polysaccharide deacetylase family protein [Candidatus Hinthialibacter antarcticus]